MRSIVFALGVSLLVACSSTFEDTPPVGGPTSSASLNGDEGKKLPETTEKKLPEYERVEFELTSMDTEPSVADKKRCTDAGGNVLRAGLRGAYHCIQDYPDAGKVCGDSSECQGFCQVFEGKDIDKPGVTGTCQKTDVAFGCYGILEDGFAGGMLCVD